MTISFYCHCGHKLKARTDFAGRRAECPRCGEIVQIPEADQEFPPPTEVPTTPPSGAVASGHSVQRLAAKKAARYAEEVPMEILDFIDPPSPPADKTPEKPVLVRMLEALLDPRAIHWMLTIGGGLAVLGLIIWLVSLGIFEDPRIVATFMGGGSLAVLGAGWWVTLKTTHKVAGQALTFLGCVVCPLNLWFYHAQDLITLDEHLWLGGLVCVGLFAATVRVLRDPLFMYAVEAGVTLTALLLMADLGLVSDIPRLSLLFAAVGFLSIHAERAFAPEGEFSRKRYGLPLFWCGHAQLAVSLLMLLGSQALGWMVKPLDLRWTGNLFTERDLLAGGLWLAGTYLYLYSDLVVRRVGVYTYLGAFCLLMALVSLVLPHVNQEGLIAALAVTALAIHVAAGSFSPESDQLKGHAAVVASLLAQLPVLLGVIVHLRATSEYAGTVGWGYDTGWWFVGAMLLVAATNRVSAFLSRTDEPRMSATHFFFSAAGLLVAAAGLLRVVGWTAWAWQAPVLMLVPIAYLLAARWERGGYAERPLRSVSRAATVVILTGSFAAALERGELTILRPLVQNIENLLLGLTFAEAALYFSLAGIFYRRSRNAYLAAAAGCGALWQFLGYFGVESAWHELLFALMGVGMLLTGRRLGLEQVERYQPDGDKVLQVRGRGATAFQSGNAILTIAFVVAFLTGLGELAASETSWLGLFGLLMTAAVSFVAIWLVPNSGWRRWYSTATVALAGVLFLQLNVLIELSGWQKLEIFSVAVGLVLLAVSHVGRFREQSKRTDDSVTTGLWLGSLLATMPLFAAMLYHRFAGAGPSLLDELALLTVTVLMLVSGCSWQMKSTTLIGGSQLLLYLLILIGSIAYRPQVAVGVYLLAGGGLIFAAGIVLSIYRDRLLALPEQIARREGLFRVMGWR